MLLKELVGKCPSAEIHLHDGRYGKLITKTSKGLEKYGDVLVLSIYPQIYVNNNISRGAYPYLYVYGDWCGIQDIKRKSKGEK